MERRKYVHVGLTAASLRPTSMEKPPPTRIVVVTHLAELNNEPIGNAVAAKL
jgi:hypothetical protein